MKPHRAEWRIQRASQYMVTYSCTKHLSQVIPDDAVSIELYQGAAEMCRCTESKRTARGLEYFLMIWLSVAYGLDVFDIIPQELLIRAVAWCTCTALLLVIERLKERE